MDLLLYLVGQHKVSIHDVPIFVLIEQYLSAMEQLRESALELEAEFLEMAARLVYIKTVALLPVHKEAEDLAEELRVELLEYRDCQLLAGELGQRANGFGLLSREPQPVPPDFTYKRRHEPQELYAAFLAAVGKGRRRLPPPVEAFSGILAHRIVSVVSRFPFIFDRLRRRTRAPLLAMLEGADSRSELVATFLAVLAMIKAKRVTAHGEGAVAILELQEREEEWLELEEE
jgi:segregation and condensation protein A